MLSEEPPRTQGDLRFRLLGVPVRVHPLFWLVAILLGLNTTTENPKAVIVWLLAVFVCILVHEMGHALVARWYGWEPHITLHALGGVASYRPSFRHPRSEVLISLAGPLAGFALAGIILAAAYLSGQRIEFDPHESIVPFVRLESPGVRLFVFFALYINLVWGLVNLLPVYPLDGGRIARELLGLANPDDGLRQSHWLSVFTGAAMAVYGLVGFGSVFVAVFFGYMAYVNYLAIGSLSGRGDWS